MNQDALYLPILGPWPEPVSQGAPGFDPARGVVGADRAVSGGSGPSQGPSQGAKAGAGVAASPGAETACSGAPISIVTGASSGLGAAIYRHLIRRGDCGTVLGVGIGGPDVECNFLHDHAPLSTVATFLYHNCQGDPSLRPSIMTLVNCAGIMPLNETKSFATCRDVMKVNFWTPFELTRLLLPYLIDNQSSIINITSTSGIRPEAHMPIYSASKAALESLTVSTAKELAPRGIRVNCISPGIFDTNIVEGPTPQDLIDKVPLKREASPDEITPVIDMLLDSRYTTASHIVIDGGIQWNM